MKTTNKLLALNISAILLTGCGAESSDKELPKEIPAGNTGVAVGATSDRSSASTAIFSGTTPSEIQTELNASSKTDTTVNGFNKHFYRIDRYNANTITKFNINAPETAIWQCSTNEESDTNSNPYQIIHLSETKAYVLRYGTGKIWVVNPNISDSTQCNSFKTGEIDLASFDENDSIPNMSSAVITDGKLFVAMQLLNGFTPEQASKIAVIDTATDTLIDTDTETEGTQAIQLTGKNIGTITYSKSLNKIIAQSIGQYAVWDGSAPAGYSGGIESINPENNTVTSLVDDTETTTKQISDIAIISADKAYMVGYASYQNNSLYQFNPATGATLKDANSSLTAIAGLTGVNISSITKGPDNTLWIATDSGFKVIDTTTNTIKEALIDTKMNPTGLVFINK